MIFPAGIAVRTLLFGRNFRKVRRSRCCSSRRSNPAILCWNWWSSASGSSPEGRILCVCVSRTSRSTSWLHFRAVYSATRPRKEVLQILCGPRCCYKCPRIFSNRLMVPKTILLLGFVDRVDHIASSIRARLVVLSELSAPSSSAHPKFSYISLSQCKLQTMCCRERLHVTVNCKSFSWASFTLHPCIVFWRRFKVFLFGMIRGFVRMRAVSPMPYPSSIGFTVVKKAACLPLLRLVLPWINPFVIQKFNRVPDVVDVLSKSFQ